MIQREDILDKIGPILSDLLEQYEALRQAADIKEADLALFELHAKYLSGHARILKKLAVPLEIAAQAVIAEKRSIGRKFWTDEEPGHRHPTFPAIEESPIAGVDIPETEAPEQQEELIENASGETEAATEAEKTTDEQQEEPARDEPAPLAEDKRTEEDEQESDEQASSDGDESPVMRYVEDQEVEETLFTPATADLDSDTEEFSLDKDGEDKKADEEEDTAEEEPKEADSPVDEDTKAPEVTDEKEEPEEAADDVEEETNTDTPEETHTEAETSGDEAPDPGKGEQVEAAHAPEEVQQKEVVIEEKEVVVPSEEPAPQAGARPMSLNDLFSAQRKREEEQKPVLAPATAPTGGATKRIQDLKSAVSLNDKLLFIKDLFNGYSLAYSEAMDLLGRYDNFADADAFLQDTYAGKNNWAAKQLTVDKFYAILKQKYNA